MKQLIARLFGQILAALDRRRERRSRAARATQNARLMHVGGTVRRV